MRHATAVPALPFRDFLTFAQINDFVDGLTKARPDLCRPFVHWQFLERVGRSIC